MLERQKRRRWVVARLGASMHYAVPRMLNNAGLLARFYTDFYASPLARRVLSHLPPEWRHSAVNRALGRFAPDLPMDLVRSYPMLGLEYAVAQRLLRNREALSAMFLRTGERFAKAVVRDGFAGGDGLYCFNTAGLHALRAAKERGLVSVLEQAIAPRAVEESVLAEEHERFPGWEGSRERGAATETTIRREREEWDLADMIVCPSDFVRQGVVQSGGGASKCIVVPYGVDGRFSPYERLPRRGPLRVLSVGQASLRKGIGYAREVGHILGNSVELRWVGPILLSLEGRRKVEQYVELTGAIPRNQIFEQFRWADVFFLPSVCEGSATVTYEALMSGLPVVTTPNTGSIVTDGINGFVLPVRDAGQMAEKLRQLQEDGRLLQQMQRQAVGTSREASIEAYQERLLGALEVVPNDAIAI
jgi:glycosyltransferase involved in cell wall biosynthesis